jgi:DNA-binding transcriptional ArsR family regulator
LERERRLPYGGLFGDSNLIKVLEQMIADPDLEYRPIDLEKLTKESAPTVRASLKALTSLGLLTKDETDSQHPVYRVNTESKRFIALTFLAYAVLDDKNGTDAMNSVLADYVDSMLQENAQSEGTSLIEVNSPGLATSTQ